MAYPERIVPDETEPGIVALHLKRYVFAGPWCSDRDVLDVACGAGYGTAHLAGVARRVVGVDLSAEAVEYARGRYTAPNVEYVQADAASLPFGPASFDTVCSFETIEHVRDRDAYLEEMVRVLRDDGVYIVSTPNARRTTNRPDNPFHHVEFDVADFDALLRGYFAHVELYGQRRLQTLRHKTLQRLDLLGLRRRLSFARRTAALVGTAPMAEVTLDDVVIEPGAVARATELVAVCTQPRT